MKGKAKIKISIILVAMLLGACSEAATSTTVSSSQAPTSEQSSHEESISSEDSSSYSEPEFVPYKTTVNVQMEASLNKTKKEAHEYYHLQFAYDDEYFMKSAKEYDKGLSMLSFASSLASENVEFGKPFFESIGFTDFTSYGYEKEPTTDSIGYMFSHKTIDQEELFAIGVRGFNYKSEWSNNFLIGESGDHAGFSMRTNEVYESLQTYIKQHANEKTIKIWVAGYSRAGAVSNILSHLLLSEDKVEVTENNLFTYTFEAPACLEAANCIAYENVHNINNANDLIPLIPPAKFGLGRCGVDYPIYDENVSALMRLFDLGIDFPTFAPIDADVPIEKDSDLIVYLLDCVFNLETEDEEIAQWTCNTRKEYYNRYQRALVNAVGLVFGLTETTRDSILTDLQELGLGVLSIIASGESLAEYLAKYFDEDQLTYDASVFVEDCTALSNAIMYLLLRPLLIYSIDDYKPSLERLIDMHYPETTYVLLLAAHSKE